MQKQFVQPKPIAIYVTIEPTKRNGVRERFTSRIAVCETEAEIAALIAADKKAMGNTFGGLMDSPGVEGRSYRAFRAVWTELKNLT